MTLNKIFFLLFYQILLFSIIFIILNINVAFGCVTTSGNTDTVISSDCTGNYTASGVNDTLTVNSGITMTGVASFNATNGELLNNGTITTVDNVVKGFARISNITNNGSLINTGGVYVMSFFSTVDTFTNNGTLSTSGQDVRALALVDNFNNAQGKKNSNPVSWQFVGPTNYNIIINSTTDYGQLQSVSFSGTPQFGIHSSSTLACATTYTSVLLGVSSSNLASTRTGTYNGIDWTVALQSGTTTTWDLTTDSCNTLPTLSSSVPSDDASSVARDANIILNFSESVDVESGNITIKKTSDNSTVETIDVTSSQVTGTGTSQITINPSSDFEAEIEYYVLIDDTAFDDTESGSYAGISSTTALSFTVDSMADPTTDKDVVGSIDSQSQITKNFISQSTSIVSNRLSYLRQNRENTNLSKNNIKLDFGNAILSSLTNELLAKNDKSIIPDNWSAWSEGTISVSKIGDRNGSSSSETDGLALAFGFDTKLNNNDLLGFAIQFGESDTDIGSSGSTTDSENINLSVYRTKPLDNYNFIEGMFGFGLIESDLVRVSGSNTLTGSRNGTQIFGSINYGKTIDKRDFNLTPIVRFDLGYTKLDAYSESGTDALSYDKQTIESGLASVGVEFSDIVKFNNNNLKPFGSIEYGLDFSNSSNAKMNYVSDTSTIYTYTQGTNSNHLITSVVGFEYITINNLEIISSYKRIQGNESEQTDIVNVLVKFKSKRETEYAMSIDGNEDLKAGFDISKNVNGFDLKFNANQSFNKNSNQAAEISLSRKF
tara:strand:- start:110 stop:2431 length:2322 start_codon:yes stop_codon:yes gene_type:complete